jgi:hypothetical protein
MLLFSYLKFKYLCLSINCCCIGAIPVYFAITITTVLQCQHLKMYRATNTSIFSLAFKH